MKRRIIFLWGLFATALLLAACGGQTAPGGGDGTRPTISSFSASPPTLAPGGSSTLSWAVSGVTSLSIDQGVGDVTGKSRVSVTPSATTTYTLSARSSAVSVTAKTTVTVSAAGGEGKPVIQSFSADPPTIAPGGSSTLSWSVSGATSVSLEGVGIVTGSSTSVAPSATTTYTLSASNSQGTVSAQATVTVTTTSGSVPSHFFLPYSFNGAVSNTDAPSVALDPSGGVHVAYEPAATGPNDPNPAFYGYCSANCTDASRFTVIPVAGDDAFIGDLNLRLDPQGHPRLLWSVYQGFRYAACDADCTDPAHWAVTPAISGLVDLTDGSNRMFALDAQGRPRFIYTDDSQGAHGGTFFMYCDGGCTAAANWHEVRLSAALYRRPSLALGSDGIARFAFEADDDAITTRFGYGTCDDVNCSSWSGLINYKVDNLYSDFALRLDTNNQPRVALYSGPMGSPEALQPDTSYYLWCNTACSDPQANDWNGVDLGVQDNVYNPLDMALDDLDRPRIAIETDGGMSLLSCDVQCASTGASWHLSLLDSADELQQTDPTPPVQDCGMPRWSFGGDNPGYGVALALSPDDTPHLGCVDNSPLASLKTTSSTPELTMYSSTEKYCRAKPSLIVPNGNSGV